MELVAKSRQNPTTLLTEGRAPRRWRGGWKAILLILVGLIILGMSLIAWLTSLQRHKASTYGIVDPSSAALRIENRTNDFAIRSVSIEDADSLVAIQDVPGEVGMGAETVLEIVPGTYLVKVFYVETAQVVGGRPKGSLTASVTVLPGDAVVLCLQGGRSSPDSPFVIHPELTLK